MIVGERQISRIFPSNFLIFSHGPIFEKSFYFLFLLNLVFCSFSFLFFPVKEGLMALCARSVLSFIRAPANLSRTFSTHLASLLKLSSNYITPRRHLRSLADLEKMSTAPPAVPTISSEEDPSTISTNSQSPSTTSFILTLSCLDRKGIVHAVTGFLAQRHFNIRDSAQFGDGTTKRFFMRVHAESDEAFQFSFQKLKFDFVKETGIDSLDFEFHNDQEKPKTLIMVSKIGHCLNDLLFRVSSGTLPIQVPLIISNHNDYAALAKSHNIPFYHLPIDVKAGRTKEWQEEEIVKLAGQYNIDLVVLARYMQVRGIQK